MTDKETKHPVCTGCKGCGAQWEYLGSHYNEYTCTKCGGTGVEPPEPAPVKKKAIKIFSFKS